MKLFANSYRGATIAALLAAGSSAVLAQNATVANILGRFDINLDGVPDNSPDSDGDGLPDSWEAAGADIANTDVPFPAPQAIVPGTPATPIFSRQEVRTSANARDTDGDGLTDFIEVFGLKFIDDNNNGVLDANEWQDLNGDGMPSIGEFPLVNVVCNNCGDFENDFDGFVFTDPTNPDTDNDGILDGFDFEPLINPRAFGTDSFEIEFGDRLDKDGDNDGLGNGMDLGNDDRLLTASRRGVLDNPSDLRRVLEQFRRDVLGSSSTSGNTRVPEALIDDLLGADWNGDGLFRLTDMREPRFGLIAGRPNDSFIVPGPAGNIDLFEIADNPATAVNEFVALGFAPTAFPTNHCPETYYHAAQRSGSGPSLPLGLQTVLKPNRAGENPFLPDPRVWTVLYAWRVPGFDVDGDGFIGFDTESFQGAVVVNGTSANGAGLPKDCANLGDAVVTPAALVAIADPTFEATLNGQIEVSAGSCGLLGLSFGSLATLLALVGVKRRR